MSRISVNIFSPGKFHILNYFNKLNETIDATFYTSMGLHHEKQRHVRNFFLKEYLTQIHGRISGKYLYEALVPTYNALWEAECLSKMTVSSIAHVLSQGACLKLIERARRDGAIIVCEAVNTHPNNRLAIYRTEAEAWGLPPYRHSLLEREIRQDAEAQSADLLLAPSAIVAETYRRNGVTTPSVILPYAANIDRFRRELPPKRSNRDGTLKMISVGQLGLRKGQLYILEAMRHLPKKSVSLTLVGTVDPKIRPLIGRYSDLFTHIERVPSSEMPALLALHDVYISASLEEGLSVSIAEGLAMGLAVIATAESGAEEIIVDGVTGLLISSRSTDMLRDNIVRLLDERDLISELSFYGWLSTRDRINWGHYAEKIKSTYQGLVGNRCLI